MPGGEITPWAQLGLEMVLSSSGNEKGFDAMKEETNAFYMGKGSLSKMILGFGTKWEEKPNAPCAC